MASWVHVSGKVGLVLHPCPASSSLLLKSLQDVVGGGSFPTKGPFCPNPKIEVSLSQEKASRNREPRQEELKFASGLGYT